MDPLSLSELSELRVAIAEAFRDLHELRKRLRAAREIRNPQIPYKFSESLAFHLLEGGLIGELKGASFSCSRRVGDPDITANLDGKKLRIEIKATGEQAFQRVGEKDLRADYLVWLQFGRMFVPDESGSPIDIWIVDEPGRVIETPRRFTAAQLAQIADRRVLSISFDDLLPKEMNGQPVSPCSTCGALTIHTADDPRPLCGFCTSEEVKMRILQDVLDGRLDYVDGQLVPTSQSEDEEA